MREKLPLILGLGLPVAFIIVVIILVLFPATNSLPKINFVYTTNPSSRYELQGALVVVNGKVTVQNSPNIFSECLDYEYDKQNNVMSLDMQGKVIQKDHCDVGATEKRLTKLFSMGMNVFEHDPAKNESRELTVEEVLRLNLDDTRVSRDGFEFVYGRNNSDFYGFGNNYRQDYYLKNGRYATDMNLVLPASNQYGDGVTFIGWVR